MKITVTIILFSIAILTMSFLINHEEPRKYKNLKVLPKNITKDQMDSVMHHFANSMGEKCNFCHVYNQEEKKMDFVSDAKEEKATARDMWKMTAKLNKQYFDVKGSKNLDAKLSVTCFTCHHGAEHPETKPPMRENQVKANPGNTRPTQDSIKH